MLAASHVIEFSFVYLILLVMERVRKSVLHVSAHLYARNEMVRETWLFECFTTFLTFKVQRFRRLVVCLSRRGNLEFIGSRRRYSRYELLQLYSVTGSCCWPCTFSESSDRLPPTQYAQRSADFMPAAWRRSDVCWPLSRLPFGMLPSSITAATAWLSFETER